MVSVNDNINDNNETNKWGPFITNFTLVVWFEKLVKLTKLASMLIKELIIIYN